MWRESGNKFLIILMVALLSAGNHALSQSNVIEFEHLTLEDGLSSLRIEAIEQDFMGYLWFGTKRGLCRFNGYDFEVYKSSGYDTTSLGDNQIQCLFEDDDHDLWIGAFGGGLHLYNREQDNIKRISFATGNINCLSQDSEGYIWVGTDELLKKYDKKSEKSSTYLLWSEEGASGGEVLNIVQGGQETFVNIAGLGILKYNKDQDDFNPVLWLDECKEHNISEINEVFIYNDHTFWLGTDQGLFEFSPAQDPRLKRILDIDQKGIYQSISFIINESYNKIWIGANGLHEYDIVENTVKQHNHDINKAYSLSNDFVTCGYKDNQGNIWIGTYASGINIILNSSVNFNKHSQINSQLDLFSRNITAITQDKEKNLWLGTWDKGVLVFNDQQQILDNLNKTYPALLSLEKENIRVIVTGPEDNIWIGSSSGLLKIDLLNKYTENFPILVTDEESPISFDVTSLLFESDSLLWVGTSTKGLFLYNIKRKSYRNFSNQLQVSELNILDLERDQGGNLWIATHLNGLFKMDINQNIQSFVFEEIIDTRIRGANFITIYKDSRENLWFGTEFHGLIKLPFEGESSIFSISEDLKNNEITAIQEDNYGRLWLATTIGLYSFEESTDSSRYYSWREGLVAGEFNYNALALGDDNTIYFGGTNGLVYFTPGSFKDNSEPPVYIESFSIGNEEVRINQPGSPLSKPINLTDQITLKHSDNVISFEFVALNYIASGNNQYAYMLEGFDESGWNELGSLRRMTFTNLDYGNYTLRVKGSDNNGVWNDEGDSLNIRILKPPWLMWWAVGIYTFLVCGFAYLIIRGVRQQIRMKQQINQQRFEKEKQIELSNMKLQFFTNISHEFKIPLSLIISPLEEIIRNFRGNSETRQKLQMIQRNSTRLLQLIKLLIDFRKAEQDVLKLNLGRHDLISLTQDTIQSFRSVVIEQNKHIEMRTSLSSSVFEFDRDKIERVLYNMIANAVNFTNKLGEITVTVREGEEEGTICIEIQDNGIGIEKKAIPSIFEKFYQINRSPQETVSRTGSGIGLYLCKKIIELHQGNILVDSTPGKGSIFKIILPASDMQSSNDTLHGIDASNVSRGMEMLEAMEAEDAPVLSEDTPLVLLVEDDIELRIHIRKMLWNYYRVEEADNGTSGLKKAKSVLPDLILSDIIMPVMDGVELCTQIKNDPKTDHIPVILLSAKSDLESKIDGFEKGADDYLEKPFFPQHLLARIRNLIESREKLRLHFGDSVQKRPKIVGLSPVDRDFLQKVFYLIEQNIGNSEYNVNELSSELGMSRVHLYRRFKDLTGKTTKDYMKETRLKAGALLLEENRCTVSEVAYQVGFNTPSNFTASFKSFYGISPKEYKSA